MNSDECGIKEECEIKEECGIVGMINCSSNDVLTALSCLQHRGRDSFGISYSNKTIKNTGLVQQFSKPETAPAYIGHVRYSTTRGKEMNNDTIQPLDSYHPIL
jgi:glutamine phosphoribosylpyrophosphate amidotransferase